MEKGTKARSAQAGGSTVGVGGQGRGAIVLGVLVFIGLLVELPIHPRFMDTVDRLPFYRAYTTLTGQPDGGLMELPFATQQSETTGRRMLLQTVHDKPIMAGYLSRKYRQPDHRLVQRVLGLHFAAGRAKGRYCRAAGGEQAA